MGGHGRGGRDDRGERAAEAEEQRVRDDRASGRARPHQAFLTSRVRGLCGASAPVLFMVGRCSFSV